ncbi:uncharacterized protein [Leptinotarsa decemlineata]|uniref:uncharacterized protein n=1 Tax=Leptinotarsa decemlineata TaxID=7539 RepID=UPI003D30A7C6
MDSAKKNIRSILTSAGLSMTMRELAKDYVEFINGPIPFRKHGFSNLEQFLRSMPDTVKVEGSGPCAIVYVTKSRKSSHLYDMISRQGKNDPRKDERRNNKRFSESTCKKVLPVVEEADVGELQNEVHRLNIRVGDLEIKIGGLEREQKNLTSDLTMLQEGNKNLHKFKECSEKQNKDLEKQIRQLKTEFELCDVPHSRLMAQENRYLRTIIEEIRESNNILKKHSKLLTERLHRLEQKEKKTKNLIVGPVF